MKELSVEEKAKAYDEALEKARQLCAYPTTKPFISNLQDLFPELCESKDEKTRKRIIALVNAHGQGIYKDDMLTWLENIPYTIDHEKREGFHLGYKAALEKQGNSPIKWNKNIEDCKPKVNHSVLMKTTHSIAEGEWKGEYWEQYRWAGVVRDSDVLSWMELSDLEKQGEQKPWNEEDEKIALSIEQVMNCASLLNIVPDKIERIRTWLKTLKQRII